MAEAQGGAKGSEARQRFGDRLIARGLATREQVAQALRVQAERGAHGVLQNLGEILVEQGVVTVAQIKALLQEQEQIIMVCPSCGERYNVRRAAADRAVCPADNTRLALSPEVAGIGVAATLSAGAAADDAPIGLEIGHCRIVEFLARGGMGAVYKAKHLALGRYVAIKMIPSASRDQTFIRRLLVEAQTVAKLEHPNIVQVYDVGYEKGYFFMVMQFLRGLTLEKRLAEEGRPPLSEALDIVRDIGRGLESAHAQGVVHRDIKPSNIIVTDDGRARITDFGLALMTESKDELGEFVVGTPGYMSPEQNLGKPVDARSDLYSLGVVFYLLATGVKPFHGATVQAVREAQIKERPKAPRSLNPDITEGIQAILSKTMSRMPERRYQNSTEFLEDLDRAMRGEDPKAILETGRFVKCGFCESLNRGNVARCQVCGEPLSTGPETKLDIALRPGEFNCRGCGAVNVDGARTCSGCLKRFCRACRRRPVEPGKPCKCGAPNP
jgi:predicted Ser/Thr protein kinase